MKRIKSLILFSTAFAVLGVSCFAVKAASTKADDIDVILEQQENAANDKIRFISTMTPVTDLASITKIDLNFTLSKAGETTLHASRTTTQVYDKVLGTNGKDKASNTYYSVFTITDLSDYVGWTLTTSFDYYYSDSSNESTNEVTYTIPAGVSVTTGTGSFEESSSIEDCFTASDIEGGNIFHAWNWSMNTIKANLDDIKAAGYTTVQTSPMQPQKDYYAGNAQSDWWKFYQPLGFCVAKDGVNNALGTKSELTSMVTTAHAKGIKVIVDVVANHLAGSYNELSSGVAAYEPKIYGSNGTLSGGALLHTTGANGTAASDSGHTTDGHIYLPDLDTGNSYVQQRVLSLLKEYIDCGVDGFRFDAAKHIETDNASEPNGSSQFWPTVINGATSYAESKGKDKPYYYGEILYSCGNNRSYSWYTKYMDVIDNTTGNNITSTFNGGNATSSSNYNTGCSANQVVVWGESHDTYANESHDTTFINQAVIDKSYAYSAARKGAQSLYFYRPCADNQFGYVGSDGKLKITCSVLLGDKGTWNAFKSEQITAVNKFHNYWADASEWIDSNGSFSEIVRYNDTESGMVIVNAGSGTSVSNLTVPSKMKDGSYTDLVTGNTFTVSGSKVSGTMSSSGIAVLYSSNGTGAVSIKGDGKASFYTDTTTVTYAIANAASATLTVDGKTYNVTSGATVTFGSRMAVGDSITVSITALAANGTPTTETFTYTKIEAPTIYTLTLTKPTGWGNTIYAYMWDDDLHQNAAWPGEAMTADGNTYTISYTSLEKYEHIIFSDGTYQSVDLDLDNTNATFAEAAVTTTHFANTIGWATVYAYAWKGAGGAGNQNSAWPGVALSKDSTGMFALTLDSTYTSIIFNNNSAKTDDLAFNQYIALYDYNGTSATMSYNIVKNTCSSHTYDAGVVTTAPTCTEAGVKTYTCSTCGSTYTEAIPALGHDYDYTVAPTWVWNGYSSAIAQFTCINNANHKDQVNATITSSTVEGVTTYTATVTKNGHTYTDTKVDDGSHTHSYTHVAAKAATCQATGNYEYYYCEDCDTYFDAEYHETTLAALTIAKTDHTVAHGVYSAASGVVCDVCGEAVEYTVDTSTIYYLVPSTWSGDWPQASIYYWTGTAPVAWPGTAMTKGGTVTYKGTTYTVYSYTFTSGKLTDYTNVIFNNGSDAQKTKNLTVQAGANCYLNNYDTANYEVTQFIYIP